jgi:hypothetical protein
MRFTTWNTFTVSTFALLSLITPVANAVDLNWVGRIVEPAGNQALTAGQNTTVVWYVVKKENPSAVCYRRSLTAGIAAGNSTPTASRI